MTKARYLYHGEWLPAIIPHGLTGRRYENRIVIGVSWAAMQYQRNLWQVEIETEEYPPHLPAGAHEWLPAPIGEIIADAGLVPMT